MEAKRTMCEACGASELKKNGSVYVCPFCGSEYKIENDTVTSTVLTDAKITALYLKAAEHMGEGYYTDELEVLSEALALEPENTTTLVKIGRCYRALGFTDKALDTYKQAIAIDPNCGTAYTNIGTILVLQQKWAEAEKQYQTGLPHIDKETDDYWVAYANYAVVVAKLGNRKKAEEMIKEAESHGYKNGDGCRSLAGISKSSQGGCYVATCVYGSYDCPEVWTLRRFRDNTLQESFLGRAFIKFYYKTSPTLVKWFGNEKWFKDICKPQLNRFVKKLQDKGYESTRYYD